MLDLHVDPNAVADYKWGSYSAANGGTNWYTTSTPSITATQSNVPYISPTSV